MTYYKKSPERELEEMADAFLADNDPLWRDRRKRKSRHYESPYLTKQQLDEVRNREIPFSSLKDGQAGQCAENGCEVDNFRKPRRND